MLAFLENIFFFFSKKNSFFRFGPALRLAPPGQPVAALGASNGAYPGPNVRVERGNGGVRQIFEVRIGQSDAGRTRTVRHGATA